MIADINWKAISDNVRIALKATERESILDGGPADGQRLMLPHLMNAVHQDPASGHYYLPSGGFTPDGLHRWFHSADGYIGMPPIGVVPGDDEA